MIKAWLSSHSRPLQKSIFSTTSRPCLNSLLRRLDEDCHAVLAWKFTHSGGAWDMLHAGVLVLLLCVLPYELSVFGDGDGS